MALNGKERDIVKNITDGMDEQSISKEYAIVLLRRLLENSARKR